MERSKRNIHSYSGKRSLPNTLSRFVIMLINMAKPYRMKKALKTSATYSMSLTSNLVN